MESARESQNPVILNEILSSSGADSLDAIARILAESPADDTLLGLIDLSVQTTGAERGFLLRRDGNDRWDCLGARNLDGEDIRHPLDKILVPLIERALEQKTPWSCSDIAGLPDRGRWDRERLPRTSAAHIIPLGSDHLLYLDHRFGPLCEGSGDDPMLALALVGIQFALSLQAGSDDKPTATTKISSARLKPAVSNDKPITMIGQHPDIIALQQLIDRVAPSGAPILITGESGTGKELAARSIHQQSEHASGPFISENCGALAENLLETELFGCMRGAFTGATNDRPGLFELAHGGTIFLDEIGDTSAGLQKKLLRVIQEGVVRRVGGQESIEVDVRVLSATNLDLSSEVRNGRFREDLYYRLNVINVHLPPLRDRGEDITLIASHFLEGLNKETGTTKQMTGDLISALLKHGWPGNIRELQNEIRRVHALGGDQLDAEFLSQRVGGTVESSTRPTDGQTGLDRIQAAGSLKEAIEKLEAEWIAAALDRFDGHRGQVCQWLGIPKTTLYAKMRRYGLSDR